MIRSAEGVPGARQSHPYGTMPRVAHDDLTGVAPTGEPVGRVLGTADATPLQFWTAVAPGSYLQLDDVVVTQRDASRRRVGDDLRGGHHGAGPARGRPVRLGRVR